jgi:hypothetical protein
MNAFENVRITDPVQIIPTEKRPSGSLPDGFLEAVREAVESRYRGDRTAMMDDPMWQQLTRQLDSRLPLAA